MSSMSEFGGVGRWLGQFEFDSDSCITVVRLYPNTGKSVVEILEPCYDDEYMDYDLLSTVPTPDAQKYGSEVFGDVHPHGYFDAFMMTKELPPLDWAMAIPEKLPVDVRIDYQRESTDLFGRIWIRDGVVKECHFTGFDGIPVVSA